MNTVKKKTSELEGAQLSWALAIAEGLDPQWVTSNTPEHTVRIDNTYYCPWIDWRQGGPIIERERIRLEFIEGTGVFNGDPVSGIRCLARMPNAGFNEMGPTPLIAAMRAFVAGKLGNEVEVPE